MCTNLIFSRNPCSFVPTGEGSVLGQTVGSAYTDLRLGNRLEEFEEAVLIYSIVTIV